MAESQANSRAKANHALYLAKITLAAWRRGLEEQEIPAATLSQAFAPGTREHLVAAYGWFLLVVSQVSASQAELPRSCEELPAAAEGKVQPAEINEFRQLEAGGWLGDMLRPPDDTVPRIRQRDNLAFSSDNQSEAEQVATWLSKLESLFDRMGDSLDEC